MGQVHPRGPDVVRLSQRGGGHNCECGAPYFDEHEIASDVRLLQIFPQQEIVGRVQAANTAMKKVYKNIIPLIIFMIVFGALSPHVLLRVLPGKPESMTCRTSKICPAYNISMEGPDSECDKGCQLKCCQKHSERRDAKVCSLEFDKREEYTERLESGEWLEEGEGCCLPESYPDKCKDTFVEVSGMVRHEKSAPWLAIALVPVVSILGVVIPLCLLLKNQNEVKKAIFDTFDPWKAKGITMEYCRPRKHSPGALYFRLPYMQQYQPQVIQPHQGTMAGQPVQVIQMVQQPDGKFYSQTTPVGVVAQQGAHVRKY